MFLYCTVYCSISDFTLDFFETLVAYTLMSIGAHLPPIPPTLCISEYDTDKLNIKNSQLRSFRGPIWGDDDG